MSVNVADRGPDVLSSAICAQALAVYQVLQHRLAACETDAAFAPVVSTTVVRLARRAEAEPWPVPPLVAERADSILASALHAEAPIAVASWFEKLPEAVLGLLERRDSAEPRDSRATSRPRPRRRATDR